MDSIEEQIQKTYIIYRCIAFSYKAYVEGIFKGMSSKDNIDMIRPHLMQGLKSLLIFDPELEGQIKSLCDISLDAIQKTTEKFGKNIPDAFIFTEELIRVLFKNIDEMIIMTAGIVVRAEALELDATHSSTNTIH